MSEPHSLIFIPTSTSPCINKTTLDGVDDISSVKPLVAFGEPDSFVCYTVDDLKTSLQPLDGVYDYRLIKYDRELGHAISIEADTIRLTMRQVEELREVIERIGDSELTSIFTQVDLQSEGLREKIREINRTYSLLSKEDKDHFKKSLYAMFRAGMYARRWKGEGHPYPKLEAETNDLDFDIDAETLTEIGNIMCTADTMSSSGIELFYKLPVITHHKTPRCMDITIQNLLSRIGSPDNKSCMRMETLLLIGTGSSYLRYLCKETIEGYSSEGYEQIAVSPEERNSFIFGAAGGMNQISSPSGFVERRDDASRNRFVIIGLIVSIILSIVFPSIRSILSIVFIYLALAAQGGKLAAFLMLMSAGIMFLHSPFAFILLFAQGVSLLRQAGYSHRKTLIIAISLTMISCVSSYYILK